MTSRSKAPHILKLYTTRSVSRPGYFNAGKYPAILISADKSLARPGRKQTTATEDFDIHISYL